MRIIEILGKTVADILNEEEDGTTKKARKDARGATKQANDLQPKKTKKQKKQR